MKISIEEIDGLLEKESGVLLLRKKSEESFFETIFGSTTSVVGLLYFLSRKKFDSLIITNKRVLYVLKNKVEREYLFKNSEFLATYNAKNPSIIIIDNKQKTFISLSKLRVSYEESTKMKDLMIRFMNRAIPRFSS